MNISDMQERTSSGALLKQLEHMKPQEAMTALRFVETTLGPMRDGIIYTGAPDIPGLRGIDVQRWHVYWAWLEQSCARSFFDESSTFARYCTVRGICRCMHGDCVHGDGDCKGVCEECNCTSYKPLDAPPMLAIVYLTTGSVSLGQVAHAQQQLSDAERLRAEADRKMITAEQAAERIAEQRTQELRRDADTRLQEAARRERAALSAEQRIAEQTAALLKLKAEREAEMRRSAARDEAKRTGNRLKAIDVSDDD